MDAKTAICHVLAAVILAPLALHADVIFSNVSGNAPTGIHFLFVSGASDVDEAEAFTPSGDFSMNTGRRGGPLSRFGQLGTAGLPDRGTCDPT
jgi:hypothetical protein